MAFPTTLQDLDATRGTTGQTLASPNHITHHALEDSTIEALEAKVGVDGSAVTTSHDYKLSEVTSTDKSVGKTATQTLTNKTLTSPVLTSPTLNVGSDAEGDTYYRNGSGALVRLARGTDNYIYKMNGNVPNWEAETVVVAATDTVQGIGILATAAQIASGTASESGYPLLITPDQLAASTPVFNGSALTSVAKKTNITTTDGVVSGTGTETDFLTVSIPANTLGTNSGITGRAYFTWTNASTTTKVLKLIYGSTTVGTVSLVSGAATGIAFAGYIDFVLLGAGSTSSQEGSIAIGAGENGLDLTATNGRQLYGAAHGTAAENSTGALNLKLSWTQNSGETFTMRHAIITQVF